jgi:hypothetical protein
LGAVTPPHHHTYQTHRGRPLPSPTCMALPGLTCSPSMLHYSQHTDCPPEANPCSRPATKACGNQRLRRTSSRPLRRQTLPSSPCLLQTHSTSRWAWAHLTPSPLRVSVRIQHVFCSTKTSLAIQGVCRTTWNRKGWLFHFALGSFQLDQSHISTYSPGFPVRTGSPVRNYRSKEAE